MRRRGAEEPSSRRRDFKRRRAFAPRRRRSGQNFVRGRKSALCPLISNRAKTVPGVVGYDYNGGTSYGTYQISSRAGTMKHFMDYLSERAPDLAGKLKAAGSANTGSASGKMPEVWKNMAAADPVRFSKLQYDFIEKTHYLPALQEISERTGLDISKAPRALQEVLWSTAVQHGPNGAAKIFTKAIGRAQAKNGGVKLDQLIGSVYAMRAGQFGSSGPRGQGRLSGTVSEKRGNSPLRCFPTRSSIPKA